MLSSMLLRASAVAGVTFVMFGISSIFLSPGTARTIIQGVGFILFLFWLTGHYLRQRKEIGRLGCFGYIAGVLGTLQMFAWVITGQLVFGLLIGGIVSFLSVWGFIMYGTASMWTGIFPRGATILWMIGILLMRWEFSAIMVCSGILWSSYVLLSNMPNKPTMPVTVAEPAISERHMALDALRGFIIILMAIDHASIFIRKWHPFEVWNAPLPIYHETALFLTRFVTHLCAPGFFFLMGAGMILFAQSRRRMGWSEIKIRRYLVLRGIALIAIEALLWNPLLYNRLNLTNFGVLYGLGSVMIIGGLFLCLGRLVLLSVGAGIVLLTQVLPFCLQTLETGYSVIVRLLLLPGTTGNCSVLYPVIPWLGIATLGMAFGIELQQNREKAYHLALLAGLACLLLFPVVRLLGSFGNFQPPAGSTWIDFLNVVKYPPSLVFTLLTLGVNLILLYLFAKAGEWFAVWGAPLLSFGRTALYFYLAHWFLYAATNAFFRRAGSLLLVYLVWGAGLVLLYPVSKRFEYIKRRTAPDSMWRLI